MTGELARPDAESPSDDLDDATIAAFEEQLAGTPTEAIFMTLEGVTHHPDLIGDHLRDYGRFIGEKVRKLLGNEAAAGSDEPKPIDEAVWRRCIDPAQPTLAFRLDSGDELLAVAAQRLRQRGEAVCNVIILPWHGYGDEGSDGHGYFARRGMLIDADGTVYAGDFPDYLQIHGLQSSQNRQLADDQPVAAYLNSPSSEMLLENKPGVHRVLAARGVPCVEPLLTDAAPDDPELHVLIAEELQAGRSIVVKPTDGRLGHGVIMVDARTTSVADVLAQLESPAFAGGRCMVEPWMQTREARFTTGVRLDWVVRALIVDGELIGAYARIGRYGEAININRGAAPSSLEQIWSLYGLDDSERQAAVDRLESLCQQIATVFPDAGKVGADIHFNEAMRPRVLELNGEGSGGLENIMQHTGQPGTDWEPAYRMVRALQRRLQRNGIPQHSEPGQLRHFPRIDDTMFGLKLISRRRQPLLRLAARCIVAVQDQLTPKARTDADSVTDNCREELGLPYDSAGIAEEWYRTLREIDRRYHAGDYQGQFGLLNAYVNADPGNLKRQAENLEEVRILVAGSGEQQILSYALAAPSLGPEAATAIGRALAFEAAGITGSNLRTISPDTLHQLQQHIIGFLRRPPGKRRFPDIGALQATDAERHFVAPVYAHFAVADWLSRDDQARLQYAIRTEMQQRANPVISARAVWHLSRVEQRQPEAQRSFFLALLSAGDVPGAYREYERLPEAWQPGARQDMLSMFARYTEDAVPVDGTGYVNLPLELFNGLGRMVEALSDDESEAAANDLVVQLHIRHHGIDDFIAHNIVKYLERSEALLRQQSEEPAY